MFTVIYWLWREEEFIILALLALMTAIIWKERGETAEMITRDILKVETFGLLGADRAQGDDVSQKCGCVSRGKSVGFTRRWQAAMPIQNFIRSA